MAKEKIKLKQAVVVEGKYDKIKLSGILDAVILTTGGFEIYKRPELCKTIRMYAEKTGLIVVTDSDRAGRQIRAHIKRIVPKELHSQISSVHIPQICGKEKRKVHPSKEGTLGVEGIPDEILIRLFEKYADESDKNRGEKLTKNDLYMLGLTGGADSSKRREELAKRLDLPSGLSTAALLDLLNTMYGREEVIAAAENL